VTYAEEYIGVLTKRLAVFGARKFNFFLGNSAYLGNPSPREHFSENRTSSVVFDPHSVDAFLALIARKRIIFII
jgi:hypothetical protein